MNACIVILGGSARVGDRLELLPVRAGYSMGGSICGGQQASAERAVSRLGGKIMWYLQYVFVYVYLFSLQSSIPMSW